ncbi:MAG: extracellular solute-binding protein [Clostridiales bacterium]
MKTNFIKKFLLLLLVTSMILSIVSCGDSKDEGTENGSESKTGDKPEKITLFVDTFIKEEQGQKQIEDAFKESTGIELELIQPEHNQYYDRMNVVFASGNDVPDVIEISEQNYVKYASEGALIDVDNMVKGSDILSKIDESYLDAIRVEDKLYGVPLQTGGGVVSYVRQDWLDNLGLEAPKNYEEYYSLMEAFRDKDPDKNGKKDTIPFTAVLSAEDKIQLMYLRDFFWDSSPDFTQVDGKWIDGFAEDNFETALERMAKAYKDKLIDSEIFTNETSTCRDKFTASKAGIFPYWNNYWVTRLENTTKQQSDEKATLTALPSIKESYNLNRAPLVTAITAKCEDPDGVFKYLLEYMHDGGEGQTLFCFGAEDTHWEKGSDGKTVMKPQLNNPEQLLDKVWFSADNTILPFNDDPIVPVDPKIEEVVSVFNEKYEQLSIFPASKAYTQNYGSIDKLRVEVASEVIIGKLSPADGIKKYKTESEKLQIEQILTDFNK